MIRTALTVAPEITACVGEGREPTVQELGRLADRVHREIWGEPAVSWEPVSGETVTRLASLRIAQAALLGHPETFVSSASAMLPRQPVPA